MRNRAFCIIELLIAIFILSIGILAIVRLNISSLLGVSKSDKISCAVFIAQNFLEERIINTTFENLNEICNEIPNSITLCNEVYTLQCEILNITERLKQILLTVYWGYNHQLTFSVYRAQGE